MSGECETCGEHCLDCRCDDMKEIIKMKRRNLEFELKYMSECFPYLTGYPYEDEDE